MASGVCGVLGAGKAGIDLVSRDPKRKLLPSTRRIGSVLTKETRKDGLGTEAGMEILQTWSGNKSLNAVLKRQMQLRIHLILWCLPPLSLLYIWLGKNKGNLVCGRMKQERNWDGCSGHVHLTPGMHEWKRIVFTDVAGTIRKAFTSSQPTDRIDWK